MKIKSFLHLLLVLPTLAFSQVADRMDSLMQTHYANGFNGNVIYSKEDSIHFKGNYGYLDLDKQTPLNDSSIFELASCSKQFTALAIVQLVEKGRLTYETKVEEIIEDFPYQNISIEHLLRHQSGLPDYMDLMRKRKVWNRDKIATNQDVIDAFRKFRPKIDFEPGTEHDYSNTGYLILASVIEKISNQSYGEYLRENIFLPAGMKHSRIYRRKYKPEKISNLTQAFTYSKKKKTYVPIEQHKKHKETYWLDGIVGDGMVNSTILDLEKWKQAIHYNKLISPESKKRMFSTDDVSTSYGYGFIVENTKGSGQLIYHSGGWAGYYSIAFYLPKTNEYIVALCNNEHKDFFDILSGILKLRDHKKIVAKKD